MSEMKMSDAFESELSVRLEECYFDGKQYCLGDAGNWGYRAAFTNKKQAKYAAHAINTHDSLVEEVERLRGERDELVKLFDGLERVTDIRLPQNVDQEHIGEAECLHGFRRAYLDLLAKIKGEDSE